MTLGVCATLQLLARVHASVDMPYHLPSLLGRLVGCLEEVSLASFPVVLRNLFHWSQAPPGVREMSSFYPGANHLMDIYLTRPSRAVVSPHCPTQELLAKILGIWHVSLRPPGLHPETPSGGAGGLMASSLLGPHIADSPYCVDPSPAGASLKETPHPKHL